MTNLLDTNRPRGQDKWKGFIYFKLHRGRDGSMFEDKCPRYVGFYNGVLVAEKHHFRDVELSFLRGELDYTCRQESYIGLITKDQIG